MIIEYKLDKQSIDEAIRQLNEYDKAVHDRLLEACDKVAQVGVDNMQSIYQTATYPGTNDVSVGKTSDEHGTTIAATGSSVSFIEFGAGITFGPQGVYAAKAGAVGLGHYGKKQGGTGYPWIYVGDPGTGSWPVRGRSGANYTLGNPAANALPQAMKTMEENRMRILREEFSHD